MGLQGYGIQGEFRRADAGALGDLVVEAGLGWVKQQVAWREVENQPGLYFWTDLDAMVATMHDRGLSILFSVVKAPDFYKAPEKRGTVQGPPTDPTHMRTFMRELATRFKGRVQAYEIWNEENLAAEWGTIDDTAYADFVELLKQAYIGVKEADPDAIVVLGALTPTGVFASEVGVDDAIYFEQLLAVNDGEVANYFEALGIHPNGGPNAPDDTVDDPTHSDATCEGRWSEHPSFFFNRYQQLYQALLDAGITDKTIWITEFGWATIDGPGAPPAPAAGYEYAACNTELDQANFIVRAFAKVREESPYVTHVIIWNLNFQQVVPNADEKWAFGVLYADLSPRPAYMAIKEMPKP